jgi:hypothetical protein
MGIEKLELLIGEWKVEAGFPGADEIDASCVFERLLGGAFLLQRQTVDYEPAPDSHSIISAASDGDGFTQHYFDSRGVVRVYAMTFDDGRWTLLRDKPDFSPLDFAQRYTGELSDDGSRIDGAWEIKEPGEDWRLDFTLNYVRR